MESSLILMMDHHIVKQDGRSISLRAFQQILMKNKLKQSKNLIRIQRRTILTLLKIKMKNLNKRKNQLRNKKRKMKKLNQLNLSKKKKMKKDQRLDSMDLISLSGIPKRKVADGSNVI